MGKLDQLTNSGYIEYKGYIINPMKWFYSGNQWTNYEIMQRFDNHIIIYYKDNGTSPKDATLTDSSWQTIEEAKMSIDQNSLIKGGVFLLDKSNNLHWRTFKEQTNKTSGV
jgi:hypothetical protein